MKTRFAVTGVAVAAVLVSMLSVAQQQAVAGASTGTVANGPIIFSQSEVVTVLDGEGRLTGLWEGSWPAWSPDLSEIAYIVYPDAGGSELWIRNSDSSNPRLIRADDSSMLFLEWSPQGDYLVMSAFLSLLGTFIATVEVESRTYDIPHFDSSNWPSAPSFSPDGSTIVFEKGEDLWAMAVDGSSLVQVTDTSTINEGSPDWSLDGEWLTFTANDHDTSSILSTDIYVSRPDGSERRRVAVTAHSDFHPHWSPDGSEIVSMGFDEQLYVSDVATGQTERLPTFASSREPEWGTWYVPVAVDDAATVSNGGVVDINVLANDSSYRGASVEITISAHPVHGSSTDLGGGIIRYSHAGSDGSQQDSISYSISDQYSESEPAQVTIQIEAPPDPSPDPSPTDTFIDDDDSIFEADIEAIAASGVTKGCNPPINDRFCPKDHVTRETMAAFIVRALGLTDGNHPGFVDVPSGSLFENDIKKLAQAGITRGCNPPLNDQFCPKDVVTRETMAAFMVRALGLTDANHPGFVDVEHGSLFENDIKKMAKAGITKGCNPPTNDRFCPKATVTREVMAAFMARAGWGE